MYIRGGGSEGRERGRHIKGGEREAHKGAIGNRWREERWKERERHEKRLLHGMVHKNLKKATKLSLLLMPDKLSPSSKYNFLRHTM